MLCRLQCKKKINKCTIFTCKIICIIIYFFIYKGEVSFYALWTEVGRDELLLWLILFCVCKIVYICNTTRRSSYLYTSTGHTQLDLFCNYEDILPLIQVAISVLLLDLASFTLAAVLTTPWKVIHCESIFRGIDRRSGGESCHLLNVCFFFFSILRRKKKKNAPKPQAKCLARGCGALPLNSIGKFDRSGA